MARRRYFGRKRRGGSGRTIPIMGIATAGAFGAGLLLNDSGYGVPITALKKGDAVSAGGQMLANMKDGKTYYGMAVPIAVWILGRMLLGKRKVTKRISIF